MSDTEPANGTRGAKHSIGQGVKFPWRDVFPFLNELREYDLPKFLADLKAGMNTALLGLPQGMAYALIAGLPIQTGIYATAIAPIVSSLLSHSRYTAVGPTNATAVLVSVGLVGIGTHYDKVHALPLFVAMVGLFLLAGGLLRVASLSQFISMTVIIGYITVAAFWIIAKQIGPVIGVDLPRTVSFFDQFFATMSVLPQANLWAVAAALVTLLSWFVCKKRFPKLPALATSILVGSLLVAVYTRLAENFGWPEPRLDYLSAVQIAELRLQLPLPDWNLISLMTLPALAVAFLAALENTSMSKSIAARKGEPVDPNKDMFALGAANLACACTGSMPASGSLTRTAVNVSSGAFTQLSSFFSGLICLLGAAVLGPLIAYVPEPVLAVSVICIAVSLIDRARLKIAYNSTRSDMVVLLTTVVAGFLVRLDVAIFIGVATSIALFLRKVGQPSLVEYSFDEQGQLREMDSSEGREHPSISIIHVEGDLFFGSADLFRDQIRRIAADTTLQVIILRMRNARHLDATSVMALQELIEFLRKTGRHLIVSGAMKDVYRVLKNSGTLDILGRDNVFIGSTRNPNLATRNALKRARELIGGSATVRIYYDPAKKQTS